MPVTIRTGALNYKDPTTGEYVGINAVEDGSFSTIAPSYSTLTFPVAAGQLCYQNGSLFKAKDAIATSETWTPAHWDEVTIAEELASKSSSGSVDDVQLGGTSIVVNGVANIPPATTGVNGYARIDATYGVNSNQWGRLYVQKGDSSEVKDGIGQYRPIVPYNQHESAFYGLAKAAGDSTQSASANAVGTYTAGAKTAIQGMLDVPSTADMQSTIIVGDDQPQQASNKLWVDTDSTLPEYQVPTVAEMNTALGNKVSDVQVNGTSIVSNGVANIPLGNPTTPGVVRSNDFYGTVISSGVITLYRATDTEIKQGTVDYHPLTPLRQHQSAFYGLAKAAGVDMASSSNAVGTYTDEAKVAIQKMLGLWTPKCYFKTTPLAEDGNIGNTELNFNDITIDIYEELVVLLYQSGSGQEWSNNDWNTVTVRDVINNGYVNSEIYLKGNQPAMVRYKRTPFALYVEASQANGVNTKVFPRTADYADTIRWMTIASSNSTLKAGAVCEAYIHRFI